METGYISCKCKKGCCEALSKERVLMIRAPFEAITNQETKDTFLANLMENNDVKERRQKRMSNSRNKTTKYYFELNNIAYEVCRVAFSLIFGVTQKKITVVRNKIEANDLKYRKGKHAKRGIVKKSFENFKLPNNSKDNKKIQNYTSEGNSSYKVSAKETDKFGLNEEFDRSVEKNSSIKNDEKSNIEETEVRSIDNKKDIENHACEEVNNSNKSSTKEIENEKKFNSCEGSDRSVEKSSSIRNDEKSNIEETEVTNSKISPKAKKHKRKKIEYVTLKTPESLEKSSELPTNVRSTDNKKEIKNYSCEEVNNSNKSSPKKIENEKKFNSYEESDGSVEKNNIRIIKNDNKSNEEGTEVDNWKKLSKKAKKQKKNKFKNDALSLEWPTSKIKELCRDEDKNNILNKSLEETCLDSPKKKAKKRKRNQIADDTLILERSTPKMKELYRDEDNILNKSLEEPCLDSPKKKDKKRKRNKRESDSFSSPTISTKKEFSKYQEAYNASLEEIKMNNPKNVSKMAKKNKKNKLEDDT